MNRVFLPGEHGGGAGAGVIPVFNQKSNYLLCQSNFSFLFPVLKSQKVYRKSSQVFRICFPVSLFNNSTKPGVLEDLSPNNSTRPVRVSTIKNSIL
jgi:hypothetical protein